MFLLVIAWSYVVLMMAIVEATSRSGSLLGAFITLLLYGVLPLGIVVCLLRAPARAEVRRRSERGGALAASNPDGGGHPTADAVATKREEPRCIFDGTPAAAADAAHTSGGQAQSGQSREVGQPLAPSGLPGIASATADMRHETRRRDGIGRMVRSGESCNDIGTDFKAARSDTGA